MQDIIAIDPGMTNGGYYSSFGLGRLSRDELYSAAALNDFYNLLLEHQPIIIMEDVGYYVKRSKGRSYGPSGSSFKSIKALNEYNGHIKALATLLDLELHLVRPQQWEGHYAAKAKGVGYEYNKAYFIDLFKAEYPNTSNPDAIADAWAIHKYVSDVGLDLIRNKERVRSTNSNKRTLRKELRKLEAKYFRLKREPTKVKCLAEIEAIKSQISSV